MTSAVRMSMIADEVMSVIERERRISRDDLIGAVAAAEAKYREAVHPAVSSASTDYSVDKKAQKAAVRAAKYEAYNAMFWEAMRRRSAAGLTADARRADAWLDCAGDAALPDSRVAGAFHVKQSQTADKSSG